MKILVRLSGGPAAEGVAMTLDLPSLPAPGDVVSTWGEGGVGGVYVVRRRHWHVHAAPQAEPGARREAAADVVVECDYSEAGLHAAANAAVVKLRPHEPRAERPGPEQTLLPW
jgi:hypothetical protein